MKTWRGDRCLAFGITREELTKWKEQIDRGEMAFLTHYWRDDRFPDARTISKVGCKDLEKLKAWGRKYGLKEEWIHYRKDGYSHFDLMGEKQKEILLQENLYHHLQKYFRGHY